MLGVVKFYFDSYERYQDFETGILHRISSWIYLTESFGLGSHFEKEHVCFGPYFQNKVSISWNIFRKLFRPQLSPAAWGVWRGRPPRIPYFLKIYLKAHSARPATVPWGHSGTASNSMLIVPVMFHDKFIFESIFS